jgi:hypothetical protein
MTRSIITDVIFITIDDLPEPDPILIIKGKPIKRNVTNEIISSTSTEMRRKDQKLDDAPAKKPVDPELPSVFLKTVNNPPLKKTLINRPKRTTSMNPMLNDERNICRPVPEFARTSTFNPSASFSVIILLPKIPYISPRRGRAIIATRNNVADQITSIHFHDLTDLEAPELK